MIIAEIMKVVIMTCVNMAGRCKRLCPLSGRKVRIPVSVAGVLSTEPRGDLYAWCCRLSGMRGSMHGAVCMGLCIEEASFGSSSRKRLFLHLLTIG